MQLEHLVSPDCAGLQWWGAAGTGKPIQEICQAPAFHGRRTSCQLHCLVTNIGPASSRRLTGTILVSRTLDVWVNAGNETFQEATLWHDNGANTGVKHDIDRQPRPMPAGPDPGAGEVPLGPPTCRLQCAGCRSDDGQRRAPTPPSIL